MDNVNPSMRDRALALRREYENYASSVTHAPETFELWLVMKVIQLRDVLWLNNIDEESVEDE